MTELSYKKRDFVIDALDPETLSKNPLISQGLVTQQSVTDYMASVNEEHKKVQVLPSIASKAFNVPLQKRRREIVESADTLDDLIKEEEEEELRLMFRLPKFEETSHSRTV